MTKLHLPPIDQTRARVRQALTRQFGDVIASVRGHDELRDALGTRYDSLAALECVSRVESEFGIEVDFVVHDVRNAFATIEAIGSFVHAELEDQAVLRERA